MARLKIAISTLGKFTFGEQRVILHKTSFLFWKHLAQVIFLIVVLNKYDQKNNGTPVLTVKLSQKTKPWNKKYETCHFCTLCSASCAVKYSRFYFFLNGYHHTKSRKNIMNRFCGNFVLLHFWLKNVPFLKSPNNHC